MDIEFHSGTWAQVAEFAQQRINKLREKNDGDLDQYQTAFVRGQVKAFKSLLALPEEAARAKGAGSVDDDSFGG